MKRPVMVFPDAETQTVSYLRARFESRTEGFASGVQVSNRVPSPVPSPFVWVRDDGGGAASLVARAVLFGVNVFSSSRDSAVDLANLTLSLALDAPGSGPFVGRGNFSGPYEVTDSGPLARFFFTVELHLRGSALQ